MRRVDTANHSATARIPWLPMLLAAALLAASALAACRLAPSSRPRSANEPPAFSAQSDPDIRVRLLRKIDSVVLDAPGHLQLYADSAASRPAWSGPGPITIARTPTGYALSPSRQLIPAQTLRIAIHTGLITLGEGTDAVRLEGQLELAARSDASPSAFDVIETIPIERYLPGVLAKELYHDFLPAAYEAQAIASRSYALHERSRRRTLGSHFDAEASTVDQAYAGAGAHPKAEAAVAATRGQTLTYHGHVLRTYYSSTCGDRPASAKDTWPVTTGFAFNADAPIQAQSRTCACTKSPRHRWTINRKAAATADRLRAWGHKAGNPIRTLANLRTIEIDSRNIAGRPNRYRITDSKNNAYTLTAEQLRLAFNTSAPKQPKITGKNRIWSGDLRVTRTASTLTIEGRGFGHGVGLCQFGANGLAKQGLTANQILNRYYPGATITNTN